MEAIKISAEKEGFDGIFYPAGTPNSAVIFVSGSEGGLATGKRLGAYYQSHGFSALALALFGTKHTNPVLSEVPLEYLEHAAAWLNRQGYSRIVADGISKGAEYVLCAAAVMPEICGVIARAPSYFVGEGLAGKAPSGCSSWSYRGKPLACTPYTVRKINKLKIWRTERQFSLLPLNENKTVTPESIIPVEKIHGPVLLLSTQADTIWPSAVYLEHLQKRFAEKHFPYAVQTVVFSHISHLMVPILHQKSQRLLRLLFRSERLYPTKCAAERREMEQTVLRFLQKVFAQESAPLALKR
ncbi:MULTISPECIES: acyl-CoA thioester hydrolase/BAAT C-terminal domain-containing protein [Caproicibacterium]|uniref:Acyl-CoA thioester hydrolase/BAAT C-terminal domain-containing protein n=1 Tax=Caproicibacterium argilliputei TaxID=3030016 RepID=A0AA97DBH3_9FIRM|nr:acyl-CoA thioester hydrolase/BAAT C-terminal domain-containing protein [Caproicibacterium argilliputei]WOC32560.1 acyl-CoA thioester hydrolase/BAAT C-terminal domain-containing protein [Caproicibacterium argilliputei]